MYILYKTTNIINGNYYIGKHKQRKNKGIHDFDGYLGSGQRLQNAIKKYGKENFKRETLAWAETEKEINALEYNYITEEMIESSDCYNISPGGQGGAIWSPEYREKFKKNFHKNNPMIKIMKDENLYKEWKLKHAEGCRNRKPSELQRRKNIANLTHPDHPNKKPVSEETRKKISLAKKGRPGLKGKDSPNYGRKFILSEDAIARKRKATQEARKKEIHYCNVCNVTIKTNGNWAKHLKGKKHIQNSLR